MQQASEKASWAITVPEIVDLDSHLGSANAPDLEESARLCIESGAREMILNCAALTNMTSAGLRSVLVIARLMQEAGGHLLMQGLSGQPHEIFHACGFNSLISSHDEIVEPPALRAV